VKLFNETFIIEVMNTIERIQTVSLIKTADGTLRIGDTRVSLESVVHHYSLGATAEEIAQKFPALKLAEVYGVISYYLANYEAVSEYLKRQEAEGDAVESEIESKFQSETAKLRNRIFARWENRQDFPKP
jgi:uncharacterized protein (DUF433 family)